MPNTNSSFSPFTRTQRFQAQINKLEALMTQRGDERALEQFDAEAEDLLTDTFGASDKHVEAYKYAILGDAEQIVNLPESAQEPAAQNLPRKAIHQRRQVLEGCLSELAEGEAAEAAVLTGEDAEDQPSKVKGQRR